MTVRREKIDSVSNEDTYVETLCPTNKWLSSTAFHRNCPLP